MVKAIDETTDLIHIFTTRRRDLDAGLERALKLMRTDAAIWVSSPKKASGVDTDITEDVVKSFSAPESWELSKTEAAQPGPVAERRSSACTSPASRTCP